MHRMLKHRRQLTRALMMPRYVMPLSIKGSFHFTVRLALRITHRVPVCGAEQNCVSRGSGGGVAYRKYVRLYVTLSHKARSRFAGDQGSTNTQPPQSHYMNNV